MHLLMIASAPLYVGPLVAGWIGMGWEGLPVFVALTALWLVVMRPRVWPHNLSDWTRATALSAAAQLAVNVLIVAVLFGVGRALGAISGLEPPLSPYVPIALSFLATPLSRLVWNPAVRAEPGHLVLATTIGGDSAEMVEALLALPHDTDAALIEPVLDTLFSGPEAAARYSRLEHALGLDPDGWVGLREALVRWSTTEARLADGALDAPARALAMAASDDRLAALYAERLRALAQHAPGHRALPDVRRIEMMANSGLPAPAQMAYLALARSLRSMA